MEAQLSPHRKVLIDTNVLINLEDFPESGSGAGERATRLVKYLSQLGYGVVISEGTLEDIQGAGYRKTRRLRESLRFPVVAPDGLRDLPTRAGYTEPLNHNDRIDLSILAAVDQKKAKWLITDDARLLHRARQANLHQVMTADHFLAFIEPTVNQSLSSPVVECVDPGLVDIHSPLFASLIDSYPDFVNWWDKKVVSEQRLTLLLGDCHSPLGLAVVKENDAAYGLPTGTAKICTFKVAVEVGGHRYGELLLWELMQKLREIPVATVFLEVAPGNKLIGWLERFGLFRLLTVSAQNGDAVMVKHLSPSRDLSVVDPWKYHQAFGPGAIKVDRALLVPIKSQWHSRLFSDPTAPTLGGMKMLEPCGNAITKVYMSRAGIRDIHRGDVLLFVESGTDQSISEIGVVEDTLVSSDALEIVEYAGDRTVYSLNDIAQMTASGRDQLVIRFRHDRHLAQPWTRKMENYSELVGSAPAQSIQRVRSEGIVWLKNQLAG